MFQQINFALLRAVRGASQPDWLIHLAEFAADWLIFLVPLSLTSLWLRGTSATRPVAVRALVAVAAALACNALAGLLVYQPRPFALGLAPNVLNHAADSSFPSDHGTILFTVAFVFASAPATRRLALVLGGAALATAWARVYLGVHWPLDMAGAVLVALLVAAGSRHRRVLALCARVQAWMEMPYRWLLATPIRRGWVRP